MVTRYFYPAAFSSSSGWRLAHFADDLWQAFLEIRDEQGIPGKVEIPMQYFCRTVEYALRRFSTLDETPPTFSIKVWKEAIERSGYVDTERYIIAASD
ncbi:MAG: hypothetical protein ACR2N3_06230 [Pyrinomonadaceae bacterium]